MFLFSLIYHDSFSSNTSNSLCFRFDKKRVKNKGPAPFNITLMKGPVHIAASRDFVEFIFSDNKTQIFLEWLKDTWVPDETFYASVNYNPQLGAPGGFNGTLRGETCAIVLCFTTCSWLFDFFVHGRERFHKANTIFDLFDSIAGGAVIGCLKAISLCYKIQMFPIYISLSMKTYCGFRNLTRFFFFYCFLPCRFFDFELDEWYHQVKNSSLFVSLDMFSPRNAWNIAD